MYLHPGVVGAVVSALVSCCTALLTGSGDEEWGGEEGEVSNRRDISAPAVPLGLGGYQ